MAGFTFQVRHVERICCDPQMLEKKSFVANLCVTNTASFWSRAGSQWQALKCSECSDPSARFFSKIGSHAGAWTHDTSRPARLLVLSSLRTQSRLQRSELLASLTPIKLYIGNSLGGSMRKCKAKAIAWHGQKAPTVGLAKGGSSIGGVYTGRMACAEF